MADEYGPKPSPPDRMVSWPHLIALRVWVYLAWPWQVRQMKAAGFRRVGWMTWETGPPISVPSVPAKPEAAEAFAAVVSDMMTNVREVIRRPVELHCAPDVLYALQNGHDIGIAVDWSALLFGTPVIAQDGMEPGRWEIREDGTVIGSGQMEDA